MKQYTGEQTDQPTEIMIHPGADGSFLLYQDDGSSFNYRKGEWMGLELAWHDARKVLTMRLAKGSRMLSAQAHHFEVKLGTAQKSLSFNGKAMEVKF